MKIAYLFFGALSGVIAGMGMGGGTLLIPALTLLLGLSQHKAQGVNTLSFLPAAAAALFIHKKEGRIDGKASLPIILGGMLGAGAGALLAQWLEAPWLRKAFGGFLLILSVLQFQRSRKLPRKKP